MKTTLQPITNSISSLFSRRMFVLIAVVGLALSPMMQAVVPAPDGGYPGGNTAEGDNALFTLTTGASDTAIGFAALVATHPATSTQPSVLPPSVATQPATSTRRRDLAPFS